jgi:flagellin
MNGVDAETSLRKSGDPERRLEATGGVAGCKAFKKELSPMALGVLNNLSAIYAENNLNNTNNSLQTVLRQLSSGSRINSGADDAAGLSLVNGLAANSAALTQSGTNATEGVGLLEVADGALSQVTSLLDRAITLATEASNGTLNATQEGAANQEYQSILAEINNIGSTTTYNQQAVFSGQAISIYTGDSSTTGSSIIELNIRTLSEASIGDTGGVMSYSSGQNNVFLNLSSSTANAALTDSLNANGQTTIAVNYLVKGSNGSSTTATTSISVGNNTSYANTAAGLISAINDSGLGLTATFATQAQAGVTGGGTQTGIEISGGELSAGADPNAASTSGILDVNGIQAGQLLTQGQVVTVKVGTTTAAVVTISPTVNTLQELAAQINGHLGGAAGLVTANVITNGDGTQSLALANTAGGGTLSVTTTPGAGPAIPAFTSGSAPTNSPGFSAGTAVLGNAATPPTQSSFTIGMAGTNAGTDKLAIGGSIDIFNSNAGSATTFVVGAGTDNVPAGTYYTGNHGGNTLANLAAAISSVASLDVTATVDPSGTGIVVKAAHALGGENLSVIGPTTLYNANSTLGLYLPVDGGAAGTGSPQITALDPGSASATQDDILNTGGAITLTNSKGSTTFTATAGQTYADLAMQINGSGMGVTAQWSNADHALLLTSIGNGADPVVASVNSLTDTSFGGAVVVDNANAGYQLGVAGSLPTFSTAILQLPNGGIINDGSDTLTGQVQIKNGAGAANTFIMGVGVDNAGTNTYYTGSTSVASLMNKINSIAGLGIVASVPTGGTGAIYLQSTIGGTGHVISTPGVTTLADSVAVNASAPVPGVTPIAGNVSTLSVVAANNGNNNGLVSTSDLLAAAGSITLKNGGVTHIFVVGAGTDNVPAGTYYTANAGDHSNTLANLAATISADAALGVTAQANTSGLALTSTAFEGAPGIAVVGTPTLSDATEGSYSTATLGSFASENDTISGSMSFSVNGTSQPVSTAAGETVGGLIDSINLHTATLGVSAAWVPGTNGYGSVQLTSNTIGSAGLISSATSTIADTAPTASLTYTATSGYSIGLTSDLNHAVYDSTAGQNGTATAATFVANAKAGSGVAVTSYSDGAGEALNGTNLLNQAAAQSALAHLNRAITDVAAQDGYIGAEINTLNSISHVMSTQQENVVSAQNALQATDYASATSNMSKYEILSQTGIAALAQANSVQQEVTKLLQ